MKERNILLAVALAISGCSPVVAAVEIHSTDTPVAPAEQRDELEITACVDNNQDSWCTESDPPVNLLPVRVTYQYVFKDQIHYFVYMQLSDQNGRVNINGPMPIIESMTFEPPYVILNDQGYCLQEGFMETHPTANGINQKVSLIYYYCDKPYEQMIPGADQ